MKKLFIIVFLIAGALIFYRSPLFQTNKNNPLKTSQSVKQINVEQKIVGEADFSTYQIEENKTALDLLKQTGSAVTVGEGKNAYVVGINGIKAEEEKKEFWSFYINGKIAPVGAGSYKLKNGDRIEWKKETY